MNGSSIRSAALPRRSVLLVACVGVILAGGTSLFAVDLQRLLVAPGGLPAATARIEKPASEPPAAVRQMSSPSVRNSWLSRQSGENNPSHGLKRQLLCVLPGADAPSSRLESCTELTKPDSQVPRLMGSPAHHRSPPA